MEIIIHVKGGRNVRSVEQNGSAKVMVNIPENCFGELFATEIEVRGAGKTYGTLYVNRNNNVAWSVKCRT